MRICPVSFNISCKQNYKIPVFQEEKEICPKEPIKLNTDIVYPVSKPVETYSLDKGQILSGNAVFNRSTTGFCRDDIDWRDLGSYLKENYDPVDTDFHCFACSTGEEAYTLSLLLKHIFPENDIKINASDIAQSRIDYAKEKQQEGSISLAVKDINSIYASMGLKKEEFEKLFASTGVNKYSLSEEVYDSVEFSKKNILNSLDDFTENRPSVIFARNMWPYVDCGEYDEFAKSLYDKLAPNSIIVIGGYDYDGEREVKGSNKFPTALKNAGFEEVERGVSIICNLRKKRILFIKRIKTRINP